MGCVGVITNIGKKGHNSFIIYLMEKNKRVLATRQVNVCAIGKDGQSWIDLPKKDGVKLSMFDQSNLKYAGELIQLTN